MKPLCLGPLLLLTGLASAQAPAPDIQGRELRLRLPQDQLKAPVTVPRGYAVVIGISTYKNLPNDEQLGFPEKDANNLYGALLDKEAGNFEYENVKRLIGPSATLQNIRDALENWLPSQAQEGDRVVVYFAGHGTVDKDGRGYLAPYDVDVAHLAETGYPLDKLGQVLSARVKSRWKVLFLDACHSGKLAVDTNAQKINESIRNLPQEFLTLTSSRASESSFEDPNLAGGSGLFTYFLVQGWKGAADTTPADGKVDASELVEYVRREVRLYAEARGVKQTPQESGEFSDDMLLGYSPHRREQLAGDSPELANGSVTVVVNLADVEVSVDGQPQPQKAGPDHPLKLPGLTAGAHTIRGVRQGYEPVSVDINVGPGTDQTVSLRLLIQRQIKPGAKDLYNQGQKIWDRSNASPEDLKEAADLFSRAVKEAPEYSAALLALCRVQQAQGTTPEGLKTCRRALMIDEDYVEARDQYSALLMDNGDYAEAVRQLQRCATEDPHNAFVQTNLSEALYLADRPKEAEDAANRALQLDSSSALAYLLRAEARRAQSNYDDAIADYLRALKQQEFGSHAIRVAAFYLIGTGMRKNRSGRRTIYRFQASAAYFGLCAAENGREDYLRAASYCQRGLSMDKNDPETHEQLYESYAGMFSRENRREYLLQAKGEIEATLRLNPDIAVAPQLKSRLHEIQEILPNVP
jgi:tetratricopeptide (TPR) repeat protein